ncbi:protein SERAC1 [Marchantia polymorpha subsp. ruderalis]|uniref:GPI inositol-deacylase n=1 Tax=Marchantia polymorpha TaxID=3197 RepID=A0A2R6WRE2_MARPO|nr:hypothetical protein MARPO_0064s0096 [Marchantia polymorpha]BBN18252.1 hypothetical protein Mp_8g01020 [Marchantia polymorpha subsp. ruderalis]|eukprot:PTQ36421.1 hypothetical protein MARPO_0064s0096 [Marchantia polymorpha]
MTSFQAVNFWCKLHGPGEKRVHRSSFLRSSFVQSAVHVFLHCLGKLNEGCTKSIRARVTAIVSKRASITQVKYNVSAPCGFGHCRAEATLYELYKPGGQSLLDIVFFHGLQLSHTSDAHESTWRSRGSQKEVWPMTWLPEEFPRTRILSVNYDAYIKTSAEHGTLDLHNTAESLIKNLISAGVGQHPVILVGHTYGGSVIKQLCYMVHISQSLKGKKAGILNCVKGVFFYGMPHRGSSFFWSPNGTHHRELASASPLLDYVKVLCVESARLHEYFDSFRVTTSGALLESENRDLLRF